jgi:hypothetical protein
MNHAQDILPESVFVGGGMTGLINARVDRAAQMFNERAKQGGGHLADFHVLVC